MSRERQARVLLVAGLVTAVGGVAWAAAAWQRFDEAETTWLEQVQRLERDDASYDASESDARWQAAKHWEQQLERAVLVIAIGIALTLLGRGTVWGARHSTRTPALPPPAARLLAVTWLDVVVIAMTSWLLAAGGTPPVAIAVVVAGFVASLLAAGGTPGMVTVGLRAVDAEGRPPAPLRAATATLLLPPAAAVVALASIVLAPVALAGKLRSGRWPAPHLAATGIVAARTSSE